MSLISYLSLVMGSLFLFWSFYPVISFEIYSRIFLNDKVTLPVPQSNIASALKQADEFTFGNNMFSTNLSDYTKATIWFPQTSHDRQKKLNVKEYSLSIPKLNIKKARVIVAGDDLKKGLVHYLPQTEPGEFGNVVIFGHSTLPQLWKPNNDYKSIFTYLPTMSRGDEVIVDIHDLQYTYEVTDMFVVQPEQVSVLDQQYDSSFLTLITCVPPGTYFKRLVVKLRLKEL